MSYVSRFAIVALASLLAIVPLHMFNLHVLDAAGFDASAIRYYGKLMSPLDLLECALVFVFLGRRGGLWA